MSNDQIAMELKLEMSCHLLNAYIEFQIYISKHIENKSGKLGQADFLGRNTNVLWWK